MMPSSLLLLAAALALHLQGPPPCGVPARSRPRCVATAETTAIQAGDEWFDAALSVRPSAPSSLQVVREEAAAALGATRRPRRKDEAWRRTDLSSLFASTLVSPPGAVSDDALQRVADSRGEFCASLVFVDGMLSEELSELGDLPDGVVASTLGRLPGTLPDGAVDALRTLPETGADPRLELGAYVFGALNQAALADVAYISVPADVHVDKPVRALFLSSAAPAAKAEGDGPRTLGGRTLAYSCPNLLVRVAEGGKLSLLQQYAGAGGEDAGGYFTNGLTRIDLAERAQLTHSYVQEQVEGAIHVDSIFARCAAAASYTPSVVQTGGAIARTNLGVRLEEDSARVDISGISLGARRQLIDLHSAVRHVAPNCESSQVHRNALAGRSRVVFKATVHVPLGADNTTANQLCRTLLLSDGARVDVSPSLEILTDEVPTISAQDIRRDRGSRSCQGLRSWSEIWCDACVRSQVVCTHGATIADLDDEMVFYLQSRGLTRRQASGDGIGGARPASSALPVSLSGDSRRRVR